MIEMRYVSEPKEDVQAYGVDATFKISEDATAYEMVEAFVELMKVTSMCNYNIARALKQVYNDFIYEKGLNDEDIDIEQ